MFGPYAAYIIPAYGLSAAVIVGLVIWARLTYRHRLREIAALEKQGVRRRSAGASNG